MAVEPIVPLPSDWPAMTHDQARALLTAPGAKFEMEEAVIGGVPTRVWKNAPPSIRAIAQAVRAFGDRDFTVHEGERVSYEANYRATCHIARHLVARGVGKGDRVAIAMRNLPEWPAIFFAIGSIGAIAVPLNAWWTGAEMEYAMQDSGARVLFVDCERHARLKSCYDGLSDLEHVLVARPSEAFAGKAASLDALLGTRADWAALGDVGLPDAEIAPDDDLTIFYTSGTTGYPKGALGTHRNLCTNILSNGYVQARGMLMRGDIPPPVPEPKRLLLVIPLFHVTACSAAMMAAIVSGSTLYFMRKWDPAQAMALIERERIQVTGGVPTIAWQLIEHPDRSRYDLSSLETVGYGGAPSAPELVKRIHEAFGALPGNGWGMTETMATVTNHIGEEYLARPTSAGPPVATADLKIMDADATHELPLGEVGELWARGPMIVKGYWHKPQDTAETFVNGWVRTGDLARLDADGYLYIVDRARDMVIRGGENIYSSEVEDVLYAHPAVTDAALIGVPHKTFGEEPVAVVHLAPGTAVSEGELQDWVRERLAAFKVPVAIRFVEATLPRNANGKILKTDLRALFADQGPSA